MDPSALNYPIECDTSYVTLGETNDKNDLKLKLSKLEAYSRELCLNLMDLQKNRQEITNKTLALSEELEFPQKRVNEDGPPSETDIHVLLCAKKSGCCTICKDYEGWGTAALDQSGLEETGCLSESMKVSSIGTMNSLACSCCVCSKNHLPSVSSMHGSYEDISYDDSLQNFQSRYHCMADNIGMPYISGCYRICRCERDTDDEQRFRGGMDHLEAVSYYLDDDVIDITGNEGPLENCLSCCTPDTCHFVSDWPYWDTESKSADRLVITSASDDEVPRIMDLDDDRAELEQAGAHAAVPVAPNDKTTSTESLRISKNKSSQMQYRIEGDCKAKSNAFDPPDLLRCLKALDEMSRKAIDDRAIIDNATSNKDLLTGLSVLFLVVLACISRYSAFNSLSYGPRIFVTYARRMFEPTGDFTAVANFANSVNFFAKLSMLFGAAMVSISLTRSIASMVARLYSYPQKLSTFTFHHPLGKFYKSTKRLARKIFFCAESQYYLFSYFSCLVFSFLMGKISRITDKWFLWSSRTSSDHHLL